MRFRSQWSAGFGALVVLIATIAITGIIALHVTAGRADDLASAYADDLDRVQQLRYLAERLVATSRGYLLAGEPTLRERFDSARDELVDLLGGLAIERRDAEDVVRVALDYVAATSMAVGDRSSMRSASQIVPIFDQTLVPRRAELEADIAAFTQRRRVVFERALREVDAVTAHAELVVVACSILAVACGLGLSLLASRRLGRQFHAIETATETAERAAKAREEVLAVVSHDLRSPLQAISLSATLVREVAEDAVTRGYIHTIHNATARMEHMIDELLEATRFDNNQVELHREPVSSRELLDEAVELFRDAARSRHVELTCEAPVVQVLADRERVLEILSNLIGNALKFSPCETRIAARAELVGPSLRFSVADGGPGIAADQIPHLFDRFWQADRRTRRDGLGLGLYICKRLVEAHHGAIGCDSVLGEGATFWFTLPAVANA
ncbi:MAG TPA: HAMP domain-containing sensor histidine kinase [Kofleriaceae bacterium]|jgi:signal transduction histidine kinase|nr:HAMP domain-containing sensor histidine kinase [Kofleriaceae bacterium]